MIPEDDNELKSKILSVGTIINDKLYAKSEDLSEELRQIVKNIFSDGTTVIYYQALLEHEHEWMNSQHISSEEMLKELLQKYFPDCHHARRFMVNGKKQTEKDSLTAELKRVWGDTASRSVDDLSTDLPYIPTENIWRGISGSPHFSRVTEGIYFLNDRLIITDEEADAILDYVESACDKDGFASLGDLPLESVEEVNYEIPLPTIQAAVYGRLLSDKYTLNGKILTKDNAELNSIVLLKQYLSEKESCHRRGTAAGGKSLPHRIFPGCQLQPPCWRDRRSDRPCRSRTYRGRGSDLRSYQSGFRESIHQWKACYGQPVSAQNDGYEFRSSSGRQTEAGAASALVDQS